MISRVAESCFWMLRYVERADNGARMIRQNRSFILDAELPGIEQWRPLVIVSGENERFEEFCGISAWEDHNAVENYLSWDERNPVSIYSSVRWARENARTIREVISLEMWRAINECWHWIRGGKGRRTYKRTPDDFYDHVRRDMALFQGLAAATLLHDEPYDFMRLGMFLERALQTTRILDVKYHAVGPTRFDREKAVEIAQWNALLLSCSAYEPFFKRIRGMPTGALVAGFLLKEPSFPRSVVFCLHQAERIIQRLRPSTRSNIGRESAHMLKTLVARLKTRSVEEILGDGLHDELTHIVNQAATAGGLIEQEFFRGKGSVK